MALERVQKILAQTGVASRRKAEELISEGQVTINGKVAQLGDKAEWGKDAIKVNGKLLHHKGEAVYYAFYKPKNVISMLSDPQGRPMLGEYLSQIHERVFPIGRLDFTSEGLILLTNDGDFAEKIQKSDEVLRIYSVKVKGHPNAEMLSRLQRGSSHDDPKSRRIRPHSIRISEELTRKSLVEVVIRGGKTLDIRTYFENRGYLVNKITRTAIGHLTIGDMKPGEIRKLKPSQATALVEQPELGVRRHEQEVKTARRPAPRPAPSPSSGKLKVILPKDGGRSTPRIASNERGRSIAGSAKSGKITPRSARKVIRPVR